MLSHVQLFAIPRTVAHLALNGRIQKGILWKLVLWTLGSMYLQLEFSSFPDIRPGAGLQDDMVALYLDIWGNSILFSIVVAPIYIPNNSEGFHFPFSPHTLQHLLFDRLFKVYKNCRKVALISHVSEVMLKILQARLLRYVNCEFPDVQSRLWRGRGTKGEIADIC